jgi:hypothetical protein
MRLWQSHYDVIYINVLINVPMWECTDVPMWECTDVPIKQPEDLPMWECTNETATKMSAAADAKVSLNVEDYR